ncbi:hypothetical protein FOA52_016243 [Chlamydomonas sp. UWO 241]|nr:hypothetical protein FOA52_016243 [Chlamydomonas sp. UWO 241]
MSSLLINVTLNEASGRIWRSQHKPKSGTTVLQTPSSAVSPSVRELEFTTSCHNASADLLACVTSRGSVYVLQLRHNRYSHLDRTGHAGTVAAFSNSVRQVFVGFDDLSIRCYDIAKGVQVGVLREHRSVPRVLVMRPGTNELLSLAADGIVVWDSRRLVRRRSLGNGPFPAVHAAYTPDGESLVTSFQDGSFHVWSARTFALSHSFTIPGAPPLRPRQRTFALSPDRQLLVSCGPSLPLLLVYALASGVLMHGVVLPSGPHAAEGADQLAFLPNSATVAVMCNDGAVRFINVRECTMEFEIPYPQSRERRTDAAFSMDAHGKQLSLMADGQVWLYDLGLIRRAGKPSAIERVEPGRLLQAVTGMATDRCDDGGGGVSSNGRIGVGAGAGADTQQRGAGGGAGAGGADQPAKAARLAAEGTGAGAGAGLAAEPGAAVPSARNAGGGGGAPRAGPPPASTTTDAPPQPHGHPSSAHVSMSAPMPSPDEPDSLALPKLRAMLSAFGEFPARYRLLIWARLLQLPSNSSAYSLLVAKGPHACVSPLVAGLGHIGRPLLSRLTGTVSSLAHWCPVFGEAAFVPNMVFPFVKVFAAASASGNTVTRPEACLELLATLMTNWARGWFDRFPHPPVGMMLRMQELMQYHEPELVSHFTAVVSGGYPALAWAQLSSLMSDALAKPAWLKLWDHCFASGPNFLYCFVTAYFAELAPTLLALDTEAKMQVFLSGPPPVDVMAVAHAAYALRKATPPNLLPGGQAQLEVLAQGPVYAEYAYYSVGAVQRFSQERQKISEAEEALARRKKVVDELRQRGKTVTVQTETLETERRQLAEMQTERREKLRRAEVAMLAQIARLDDQAKEEQLKQVVAIENAYQRNLESVRHETDAQLEAIQAEIKHKQQILSYTVKSKDEENAIRILEFQSRQRMHAMQQDAARAAAQAKLRDEADARLAELQSSQLRELVKGEEQEQAAVMHAQYGAARMADAAACATEAAATSALRKQLMFTQLAVEDQTLKAAAQRRLRLLAEQSAELNEKAAAVDAAKAAAASAAEEAALAVQAQADVSWYEAEQRHRDQVLSSERARLEASLDASRQQLADAEATSRMVQGQAAMMERRRELERANAEQENQARSALEAMALERSRGFQLEYDLRLREAMARHQLELARNAGATMEAGAGSNHINAVAARLSAASASDAARMRASHAADLSRLARDRDAQLVGIGRMPMTQAPPVAGRVPPAGGGPTAAAAAAAAAAASASAAVSSSPPPDPTEPTEMDVLRAMERLRRETGDAARELNAAMRRTTTSDVSSGDSYTTSSSGGGGGPSSSRSGGGRPGGGGTGAVTAGSRGSSGGGGRIIRRAISSSSAGTVTTDLTGGDDAYGANGTETATTTGTSTSTGGSSDSADAVAAPAAAAVARAAAAAMVASAAADPAARHPASPTEIRTRLVLATGHLERAARVAAVVAAEDGGCVGNNAGPPHPNSPRQVRAQLQSSTIYLERANRLFSVGTIGSVSLSLGSGSSGSNAGGSAPRSRGRGDGAGGGEGGGGGQDRYYAFESAESGRSIDGGEVGAGGAAAAVTKLPSATVPLLPPPPRQSDGASVSCSTHPTPYSRMFAPRLGDGDSDGGTAAGSDDEVSLQRSARGDDHAGAATAGANSIADTDTPSPSPSFWTPAPAHRTALGSDAAAAPDQSGASSPGDVDALIRRLRATLDVRSSMESGLTSAASHQAYSHATGARSETTGGRSTYGDDDDDEGASSEEGLGGGR